MVPRVRRRRRLPMDGDRHDAHAVHGRRPRQLRDPRLHLERRMDTRRLTVSWEDTPPRAPSPGLSALVDASYPAMTWASHSRTAAATASDPSAGCGRLALGRRFASLPRAGGRRGRPRPGRRASERSPRRARARRLGRRPSRRDPADEREGEADTPTAPVAAAVRQATRAPERAAAATSGSSRSSPRAGARRLPSRPRPAGARARASAARRRGRAARRARR